MPETPNMADAMAAIGTSGGDEDGSDKKPLRKVRNCFALLAERNHPMVRAERRRTRRGRLVLTVLCVVPPAVMALAAIPMILTGWYPPGISWAPILWGTIMILGAGVKTAEEVREELRAETAWQLVVTPLPRETIAAAKVLAWFEPFFWGMVAGLPLYVLRPGAWWCFPIGWSDDAVLHALKGVSLQGWNWPARTLVGICWWSVDLLLVWGAMHWGAMQGLESRTLPGTLAGLVGEALHALKIIWVSLLITVLTAGLVALFGAAFIEGYVELNEGQCMTLAMFSIAAAWGLGATGALIWNHLRRIASVLISHFVTFDQHVMN